MERLKVGDKAPDFELPDHKGVMHRISELTREKNALLVFNIGFAWPHCVNHLAQLCRDYDKFQALNTEVLAMVPNGPFMIGRFLAFTEMPYPILSDKGSKVAGEYMQLKKFIAIGTPTVFLLDRQGVIRYAHYATSVIEEPDNREPLRVLREMSLV